MDWHRNPGKLTSGLANSARPNVVRQSQTLVDEKLSEVCRAEVRLVRRRENGRQPQDDVDGQRLALAVVADQRHAARLHRLAERLACAARPIQPTVREHGCFNPPIVPSARYLLRTNQSAWTDPVGLADHYHVDTLGVRYKSANFGEEKSPGSPNW